MKVSPPAVRADSLKIKDVLSRKMANENLQGWNNPFFDHPKSPQKSGMIMKAIKAIFSSRKQTPADGCASLAHFQFSR
jgi:hypothetical protein